jgi:hypothetical protein
MVNLHDVRWCPTGARCEVCGSKERPLRVVTAEIPSPLAGVICLTACRRCAAGVGAVPMLATATTVTAVTAARLTSQHCEHLRVSIEQMRRQLGVPAAELR